MIFCVLYWLNLTYGIQMNESQDLRENLLNHFVFTQVQITPHYIMFSRQPYDVMQIFTESDDRQKTASLKASIHHQPLTWSFWSTYILRKRRKDTSIDVLMRCKNYSSKWQESVNWHFVDQYQIIKLTKIWILTFFSRCTNSSEWQKSHQNGKYLMTFWRH